MEEILGLRSVADELRQRCAELGETPADLQDFLDRYQTGLQLPLPLTV